MDKNDKKDLSVNEQLVVNHCQQYIRFADETQDAIYDKSKLKRLAKIK